MEEFNTPELDYLQNRKKAAIAELQRVQNEIVNIENDLRLKQNYEEFKNRPEMSIIGRAYCRPPNFNKHDNYIKVTVETFVRGNYKTSKIFDYKCIAPEEFVAEFSTHVSAAIINKYREKIIESTSNFLSDVNSDAEFVVKILMYNKNNDYINELYSESTQEIVRKEIESEKFNVLDRFSEEALLAVKVPNNAIALMMLKNYAKNRNKQKLLEHIEKFY